MGPGPSPCEGCENSPCQAPPREAESGAEGAVLRGAPPGPRSEARAWEGDFALFACSSIASLQWGGQERNKKRAPASRA
eukprot:7930241-Alexandrium_andersonii.AAC.1